MPKTNIHHPIQISRLVEVIRADPTPTVSKYYFRLCEKKKRKPKRLLGEIGQKTHSVIMFDANIHAVNLIKILQMIAEIKRKRNLIIERGSTFTHISHLWARPLQSFDLANLR